MLYTPFKIRSLEIPNRWVMSPMCMYSAKNGLSNDFHFTHYTSRAIGGTGLIMIEATAVEPIGRISNGCLGLWNEEQAIGLKRICDFIHQNTNSKVGIQLAHAGRKGSTEDGIQISLEEGWETCAPSPIPYKDDERIPHELSLEEIGALKNKFVDAAKRALFCGFDVIEIHAAHGYLLHQFLSPLSNLRTDQYGGSFQNRSRLLVEIVELISPLLDQTKGLFVRISADEYANEGWDLDQSIELAKVLKDRQVDLIDVSSGGNISGARIKVSDGYQVPFSASIRKKADIATGAVGLITSIKQAEFILLQQKADLIFVGREILRDPFLAWRGARETGADYMVQKQYIRANI